MPAISPTRSVGELVRDNPARARVFEEIKLDYCCGGKQPLDAACRARGLDTGSVIDMLNRCDEATDGLRAVENPDTMSLTELADHIERRHHEYLRAELPRLARLIDKVADAHGERDPRLLQLRAVFAPFAENMISHMMKEERILFPLIRALEAAAVPAVPCCGSVANPIRQMEAEHDDSGSTLAVMRELTDGFTPPAGACNTHVALLAALASLEMDTHQHVHKENNVLFPRAIALEQNAARRH